MPAAESVSRRRAAMGAAAFVGGLTALAFALRLHALTFQSLSNDELSSWYRTHWPDLALLFRRGIVPDVHPPGYYLILHFWTRACGDSETALSGLSVVAGSLAVPAIYLLGRSLWSHREGLAAAALLTVSWGPIFYSQDARPYALLLLTAIVSAHSLILLCRALRTGRRLGRATVLLWAASSVVCALSHYFGTLFVGLEGVAAVLYLASRPRLLGKLALLFLPMAAAWLPWIPHFLDDLARETIWIDPPRPADLAGGFRFLLNRSWSVAAGAAVLLGLGLARALEAAAGDRSKSSVTRRLLLSPGALLTAWLLAPILIAYLKSQVSTPVFTYRNLVVTLPAVYLLAARSLTLILRSRVALAGVTATLALALLLHLVYHLDYYRRPSKGEWRQAVAQVVENEASFPDALIVSWAWHREYFDYYFRHFGSRRRVDANLGRTGDGRALNRRMREAGSRHLWYLTGHRRPSRRFLDGLGRRYRLLAYNELRRTSVRLYGAGRGAATEAPATVEPTADPP